MREISSLRWVACVAFLTSVVACGDKASGPTSRAATPVASSLESDLTIGAELDAPPEYQFVAVETVLELDDGSFWVIDGSDNEAEIRRYGPDGQFAGMVSRYGNGPGEFRRPRSLAELPDGRVVLNDQLVPVRLTVFDRDGGLSEIWEVPSAPAIGPSATMMTSDDGIIWRISRAGRRRPGPDRGVVFWSRVSLGGALLDTIHPPALPDLNDERLRWQSPDGRRVRGFSLPYRARASWTLLASGDFLIAPSLDYELYRLNRTASGEVGRDLFASRAVDPVPVSVDERRHLESRTRREIEEYAEQRGVSINLEVPDVPTTKPLILGLLPLSDGGALVKVSLPSVRSGESWVEPSGWDVYSRDGQFRARIQVPAGHVVLHANSRHLWTLSRDTLGVQSVHRFPLRLE